MHRLTLVLTRLHSRLETYYKSSDTMWEISMQMFLTRGQSLRELAVHRCKDLGGRYFTLTSTLFACWASWLRTVFIFDMFLQGTFCITAVSRRLTVRMSSCVYHCINLFRCCFILLRLASGTLSLLHSATLPQALVGSRQGWYKLNKLFLSGGGRVKSLRERIRKQRK